MSKPRVCPHRKHHETSGPYPAPPWDDEFAPCLQSLCEMWRVFSTVTSDGFDSGPVSGCGLAGKP
jgi:hypothetical protein